MDARRFWLMVVGAAWLLAWGGSFAAFWTAEPTGDGFERSLNRVMVFLTWQGIAAAIAFGVWGVGRAWPRGSSARQLSNVPLMLATLLGLVIITVVLWAST